MGIEILLGVLLTLQLAVIVVGVMFWQRARRRPDQWATRSVKSPPISMPLIGHDDVDTRAMIEMSPDAFLVVNRFGVIVRANHRADNMFWVTPGGLENMPLERLIPEEYREVHRTHVATYFAAPHSRAMGLGLSLLGQRADGTHFPVEIALAPMMVEGKELRTIALVRDMTERRAASAAETPAI